MLSFLVLSSDRSIFYYNYSYYFQLTTTTLFNIVEKIKKKESFITPQLGRLRQPSQGLSAYVSLCLSIGLRTDQESCRRQSHSLLGWHPDLYLDQQWYRRRRQSHSLLGWHPDLYLDQQWYRRRRQSHSLLGWHPELSLDQQW